MVEEEVEEVEEDGEVKEEKEMRERMHNNAFDVLCLNIFSKCRLATYVGFGIVRHPRDLQVSVATRFCRVFIFASSQYLSVIYLFHVMIH